jgi:hypothetical protein
MLKKLAQIAKNLDLMHKFDFADEITEVIKKYALAATDDDDNVIPYEPAALKFQPHEWIGNRRTIDLRDPDIRQNVKQTRPDFHEEYLSRYDDPEAKHRGKETRKFARPFDFIFPPGIGSEMKPEHLRKIIMPDEILRENEGRTRDYFDKRTKGGTVARLFGLDMVSGSAPEDIDINDPEQLEAWRIKENIRHYLFSPEGVTLLKEFEMLDEDSPNLPLLDYKMMAGVLDPDSAEFRNPKYEELRDKLMNKIEEKGVEEGVKFILGYFFRRINPNAVTYMGQAVTRNPGGQFKSMMGNRNDLTERLLNWRIR